MENICTPLEKSFSLQNLLCIIQSWRQQGLSIVMCHGCFDLLHYGHLLHFREAKKFGDKLIVTITSSQYVNKGVGRPVFSDFERTDMISSLKIVDGVAISNYPTAISVIKAIRPNIYVKGIDYNLNETMDHRFKEEVETVYEVGGIVHITQTIKYSSTDFLCKLQDHNL